MGISVLFWDVSHCILTHDPADSSPPPSQHMSLHKKQWLATLCTFVLCMGSFEYATPVFSIIWSMVHPTSSACVFFACIEACISNPLYSSYGWSVPGLCIPLYSTNAGASTPSTSTQPALQEKWSSKCLQLLIKGSCHSTHSMSAWWALQTKSHDWPASPLTK